jgi:glycine/D-amino acid oxidase-like deaminating enzyme
MRYCRGEAPEVGVQRFALPMSMPKTNQPWGAPPWTIDFAPPRRSVPASADFAIVGGGFTGLAAAAWLRILDPNKSVVVIEASRIGAGASGRTGGMALGETAAGDLPGLGDVLRGFQKILKKLRVECDLSLTGAWEIGRSGGLAKSPIEWNDSGTLRVVKEVPGGTLDPGKLVSGLARAARRLGAVIVENRLVERIEWGERAELHFARGRLRAEKILFATNALSLRLAGLEEGMHPRLTLAAATAPLPEKQLRVIGLAGRKPFYTVDLPYLWGRIRRDHSIVWGAGLVNAPDENDLVGIDIAAAEPARMFRALEDRVRGLHPALASVRFTRRWGGPILFRDSWKPVFDWHPQSKNAIVLGAYAGHGVALSSYLGRWAAEVLFAKRDLPPWGSLSR